MLMGRCQKKEYIDVPFSLKMPPSPILCIYVTCQVYHYVMIAGILLVKQTMFYNFQLKLHTSLLRVVNKIYILNALIKQYIYIEIMPTKYSLDALE